MFTRRVLFIALLALVHFGASAGDRIYVLTLENELMLIDSSRPSSVISMSTIHGLLGVDERIVSIDYRPANATLYGVGNSERLYRIEPVTGNATAVDPTPFAPAPASNDIATDFDPVIDRLRLVDVSGQNLRIHPDLGRVVATDTKVAWAVGDSGAGSIPQIAAIANSNNVIGTAESVAFVIDANRDVLATLGRQAGGTGAAYTGQLYTVGPLKVDTSVAAGFDIAENGNAWAVLTEAGLPKLFSINLETGAAGFVGTLPRTTVIDLSVTPVQKGYVLPVAGRVAGANDTLFRTDIRMVNRSTAPVPVRLDYYPTGEQGNSLPAASVTFNLGVSEEKVLDDVVKTSLGIESGVGAIVVYSTSPIVLASRVYNDQRSIGLGTFGQFVPAFEDVESRSSGTLPFLANRSAGSRAGYRSNIGWFNFSQDSVRVTFSAIGASGSQLASQTLTIRPMAHQQASLAQLFPALAETDDLYVTFRIDGGAMFVYASVIDNMSGDPILVPPY